MQWLLGKSLDEVPERLRSVATLLRSGLSDGSIGAIDIWYVHNCLESPNVAKELGAARLTLSSILSTNFPGIEADVTYREIGSASLEEMYRSTQVAIEVADAFDLEVTSSFETSGSQWTAVCASVPASWLVELSNRYGESLFSANIRGYLGSRRSDRNINNGIKETANNSPEDFWVFNNGLTALVNDFEVERSGLAVTGTGPKFTTKIHVSGLAIVNGAQTTGSLAASGADLTDVAVMMRFVKCANPEVIRRIIRYNNRQNRVEAADFRSNDYVQTRLRDEFLLLGGLSYSGGRRGGAEDTIRRPGDVEIPATTASQALVAFHGDPNLAYNRKSEIWEVDQQYGRYFREATTARHLFLCFCLVRAIGAKKRELREVSGDQRTEQQARQLQFLSQRGAVYLLISAIAAGLESVLGRSLPSLFSVEFATVDDVPAAVEAWTPIVAMALSLSGALLPGTEQGLKNSDNVQTVIATFQGQLEAIKEPLKETFEKLAALVRT
ncbi:MAG: AIPR family protein [Ktedonobacteraceae bacterium]